METLWFWLVAALLTGYVVLDGFDLGLGALYLFLGRDDRQRRVLLQSIGPVWDANEVWLLAAGGSLVMAFPRLYASSFSGFYLPLMMVLWLLILRAIAIEFRSHLDSVVWRPFWDVVFSVASLLLAVFLGAALGNVVRGVPLGADGYFFNPLWTNFLPTGERLGILDWYTVLVGVTSLVALAHHGALWAALRTDGVVRDRARWAAARAWWVLLALALVLTAVTFRVQPHVPARLAASPAGYAFPLVALAGLAGSRWMDARGREAWAFLGSALFLVGMLLAVSFGLFPMVLPAVNDAAASLTVHNASAPASGLRMALFWWIPGMILVAGYTTFIYRHMGGKVTLDPDGY
ncbi:MAG: cytochrome c oxidase assembly protein [Gemmatimonadota bacterium]